ncbi:methylase involved in ubiquinone/menaquinone biosynthesis [Beggiatoa alba B18LD]|uniref:Methylase involved in ubiquinone/menaquinone biosynthesis n=1 Tax=Beggiatoa alba B18LD TaxID=395493 RepID=I3CHQ0_9GAMM|nr:class I SAM-dependent methyltransferase [Beggiatoa alba]EIJ43143.1 methylase involved in ubiquinone/menaquinone biosynthesis [Beggiatoa alba B18LD]
MKPSVIKLLDYYYPFQADGYRYLDGTYPFYQWIRESIDLPSAVVLNVGAGPTAKEKERRLKGQVKRLVGIDPDPIVLQNTDLDEAYVNNGIQLPFPDASFDAVYSDWVIEHVENPEAFLKEVYRVLKPNGVYLFRTANWAHYVTLIAAFTPHWFHKLVANRARGMAQESHEPWLTFYRMNTPSAIRQKAQQVGFQQCEVRLFESHPSYLAFNALAFRLGVFYERLVNKFSFLARFRHTIYAKLVKS